MGKYLRVTMPDESQWDVPARIIADDRARHYTEISQSSGDLGAVFYHELGVAMRDDETLIDWAANNMDWSQVATAATLAVPRPDTCDFQAGWVNGKKVIIQR